MYAHVSVLARALRLCAWVCVSVPVRVYLRMYMCVWLCIAVECVLRQNAWDTTGDGRVDAWDTTGDGLIDRVHRSSHMRTEPLLHEAVDGLPSRPLSLSPVRPRTSVESATAHNEMLPRSPPTLSEAEIDALSAVAEILDGANQQLQQDEEANQQLQEEHADSITSESSTAIMV